MENQHLKYRITKNKLLDMLECENDCYKEQIKDKNDDDEQEKEDVVEQLIKPKNIKSVVIPTNLTTANVQKVVIPKIKKPDINLDNDVQSKQELLEESLEDLIQVKDEEYEEATIPNEEIITTPGHIFLNSLNSSVSLRPGSSHQNVYHFKIDNQRQLRELLRTVAKIK